MSLGNNGTWPSRAGVVQGSESGKALEVFIMRSPCTALSASRKEEKQTKKTEKKKSAMNVGTWNVRTMMRAGKLENIKREMEKCRIDILGLCEVRWKDCGDYWSDGYRVIYSGGDESQRGVALVLNKKLGKRVVGIDQVSDRILAVEIEARPTNLVVVQVYMPTSNHKEEDVDGVYEQIEEIIRETPGRKNLVVMGDWNAVVGEGRDGNEIGEYGLGLRNDRGDKAVEFCRRNKLFITNTWFKHRYGRRYTWKSPGDTGRYQIDYIMVRQRFRNGVKNSRGYPAADADSDHNLVMMKCNVRFKKLIKSRKVIKWNVESLRGSKRREYQELAENSIRERGDVETVDEGWERVKSGIVKAAEKSIGHVESIRIKKPWITEEMIRKMEERRKWKNADTEEGRRRYRELNNRLRRETKKAREAWWKGQCDEMEKFQKEGDMGALYAKVKALSGCKRGQALPKIKSKDGKMITERGEVQNRWKEYVEELYDSVNRPERLNIEEETAVGEDNLGPGILDAEIDRALRDMKARKAVGVDNIPCELLKSLGKLGKKRFFELVRRIYEEGTWPEDFVKTILIPIPKKKKAVECGDYRTISLISHAAKVVLRIINRRLETRANEYLGDDQFGFRKGKSTRDAIAVMRTLVERNLEYNQDVFACFVDFEKAFDRVNWVKLMGILKTIGVDWRERRLIRNLYMAQTAQVKVAEGESGWAVIGRGVRQGCPLSPLLFNVYAEEMVREAWEELDVGVKVGGLMLKSVRFADDQALISQSAKGLQTLVDALGKQCEEYGMKINHKKTKVMRFRKASRARNLKLNIRVDGQNLEQVEQFNYLGSTLEENGHSSKDIRKRIALAKEAFMNRKELMRGSLCKNVKKRLVKSLIWSVALYGAETWTLRKEDEKRLEAFEMWVWRRMEKVSWTEKKRNEEVLDMVGEERKMLAEIKRRQRVWMERVLMGEGMLKTVIEGRMLGKRGRGRKRTGFMDKMKSNRPYADLKREIECGLGDSNGRLVKVFHVNLP